MKRAAKRVARSLAAITILAFVIVHLMTIRPVKSAPPTASNDTIYYFAYGSNMPARYLSNVRQVAVHESAPGVLLDHEVKFLDSGLPLLEPAFATLVSGKGHSAFGVLHRIDTDSLSRIICSESGHYTMVERAVQRLDNDANVLAWTLVGKLSVAAVPSRRYLNLLLEGAAAHDLPAEYTSKLAKLDGTYTPLLSELMGLLIYTRVMLQAVNPNAKCAVRAN